jgi:hypothetical protein
METLTNTPIFIAVYQRKGDEVIQETPYFFSISGTDFSQFDKVYVRAENTGYCYQIPLSRTNQNFDFIKNNNKKDKAYIPLKRLGKNIRMLTKNGHLKKMKC